MATYYLIDAHTAAINSSEINSVKTTTSGFVRCDGNFVIKVDDNTHLSSDPTDLTDLLTKKYQGILARYPGFSYIVYDDCLNSSDLIPSPSNHNQQFTDRYGFRGHNTSIMTPVVNLAASASQFILLVETAERVWVMESGHPTCYYKEVPYPASESIDINGTTFASSSLGTLITLPSATSTIQLTFHMKDPASILSWALVY